MDPTDETKTTKPKKSLEEEIRDLIGEPIILCMSLEELEVLIKIFHSSLKSHLSCLNYTIKINYKGQKFSLPYMFEGKQSHKEYLTNIDNYIKMNYIIKEKSTPHQCMCGHKTRRSPSPGESTKKRRME